MLRIARYVRARHTFELERHTWRPNAQQYSQAARSPIPSTRSNSSAVLDIDIHDPNPGYWESAAQKLSPWEYTSVCTLVLCLQRVNPEVCSAGDSWYRLDQFGGFKTVAEVMKMKDCICEKSTFRDLATSSSQPEQAGVLDVLELATRIRAVRAGK